MSDDLIHLDHDELVDRIEALQAENERLRLAAQQAILHAVDQHARSLGLNPGEIVAVPSEMRGRPGEWEAEGCLSFGPAPRWMSVDNSWWSQPSERRRSVCRPTPESDRLSGEFCIDSTDDPETCGHDSVNGTECASCGAQVPAPESGDPA